MRHLRQISFSMHWLRTYFFSIKDHDYPLDKPRLLTYLDDYEVERFNRFKFDHLKMTFGTARWFLKSEIEKLIDCPAEKISFQYNENGKPYLLNKAVYFSLAHTDSSIVIAISNQPVGIDNEQHTRRGEPWLNAESFLNQHVADVLATLDNENKKILSFSRYWTAMEALVKFKGSTLFQERGEFGQNMPAMTEDGVYQSQEHIWCTEQLPNEEQLSLCVGAIPNEFAFFEYSENKFIESNLIQGFQR